MSTTSLFVELIVIGSGVFLWLLFLSLACFGISDIALDQTILVASAIPVLSFIYVLGTVWDRLADAFFGRVWGDGLRSSEFEDVADYYDSRRVILTRSPELSELLEYGRSRLRICRGWTLNAPLVGLSLELYLFRRPDLLENTFSVCVLVAAVSVALTLGCWFAWSSLAKAEYRKVKEQARYIRERLEGDA
jgi:hypothetical protein